MFFAKTLLSGGMSLLLRVLTLACVAIGVALSANDCDSEFVCPKLSGSFADPCTCRRFYQCHGGTPHKSFCPSPLYWDDVKKLCTYKSEATCGPVEAGKGDKGGKGDDDDEESGERAAKCDKDACSLPFCFCSKSGTEAPYHSQGGKPPQFVLLTLDGAINNNNFGLFRDALNVSSDIRATFFVEHNYCDYYQVEQLYNAGHEIALMSVRGKKMQDAGVQEWKKEINSQRNILQVIRLVYFDKQINTVIPKSSSERSIETTA